MSPRYDIWAVSERFWGKTLPQSSNSDQQTSNPSYENWPLEVMQGDQRFTSSSNQSNNSYNWGYTQKKTSIFNAEQHTRRGYYADIGYSFGSFYNDFDFGLDSLWPWSESEHFYWGFGFSILSAKINKDYVDQASEKFKGATLRFMEGYVCLGLSYNLSFGRPYVQGNIGYYFSLDKSEYGDDYSVGGFMFSGIIGMDFGSGIIISPYYGVKYSAGKGFEDVLGISLAIDFGW